MFRIPSQKLHIKIARGFGGWVPFARISWAVEGLRVSLKVLGHFADDVPQSFQICDITVHCALETTYPCQMTSR